MKLYIKITVIILIALNFSGKDLSAKDFSGFSGANTNYFYSSLGPQHDEVWQMTKELGVNLIRFPGGTVSNLYDWEKGTVTPRRSTEKRIARVVELDDFMSYCKREGVKVVYVINIFDPTEKIVRLVQTIKNNKYPVIALELGNENYNELFKKRVGGVSGYWEKSLEIARALNRIGNKLPLGITITPEHVPGKSVKRSKGFKAWNDYLSKKDLSLFQAVILHYYLNLKKLNGFDNAYKVALEGINNCVNQITTEFPGKEIWVTEFNIGKSPKTGYHNTMLHGLFMSRIYVAVIMQQRITIAAYHSLNGRYFGLFYPDPVHFKYHKITSRNDEDFLKRPVRLIRSTTYSALKMLFEILTDVGESAVDIGYKKLTRYGNLPVDLLVIRGRDSAYVVVINPNNGSIPINEVQKYLENKINNVKVLSADGYATEAPINTWQKIDAPTKVFNKIEPLSLVVFSLDSGESQ